jgi:putative addiction module component (TIGR02574 family)
MSEGDDERSVEAEWDAEIDARVKDIEEGRVELVSTDEVIARVRARLAARRAGFTSEE